MKYVMDQPYAEASTGADDALPGTFSPYFLRAGEGPRHALFGQVTYQLLTGAESRGDLGITVTEGPFGSVVPAHVHERTYEGVYCLEGRLRATVAGQDHLLTRGDFVSIPAGSEHALRSEAHFTRFASMVGPAGLERLYEVAGEVAEHHIFPEQASAVDPGRLAAAAGELDITFAD